MVARKYVVKLSRAEREQLETLIQNTAPKAREVKRAKVLLLSDEGKTRAAIEYRVGVGHSTVERVQKRYVENGLADVLADRSRPGGKRRLDGKQAAFVVALACSETPDGQERWSMQMLADKLVELGIVEEAVSHDTVGRVLKKTTSSPGCANNGASPK